ncbi:hypothetical protein GPK90_04700 [Clostridium sp. MCC344]|nr:hypothetical protein [Clostridium sp. MCC344]MBT9788645.1 hypothetical protein [Clostridium sp. MCC344]
MSSSQNKFYQSYMSKLQEKAKEAVKEAQKKSFSEYFTVAEKKIKNIYKETIDDFYSSYPNPFYQRRGSLYNLIKTKKTDDYLSIWFEPSLISYRNGYAGEDGLYDQIFRQGWHGGADVKHRGRMLVPWSYPTLEYNGKTSPWEPEIWNSKSILSGWELAERAPISPLQDFNNRLDRYQSDEYQKDYEAIWNKNKSNIKIDI